MFKKRKQSGELAISGDNDVEDLRRQAIDLLYTKLMVDDEWSVRSDRGFSWWAYRLAQHVQVGEPYRGPDGATACDVRVWTDVATDFPPDERKVTSMMGVVNAQETMNALVWNNRAGSIVECCTSTIYADTVESWTDVLCTSAMIQNCAAHSRAHSVAEVLGGRVAASDHPTSGERPTMDDVLNVPVRLIAPEGAGPSRFAGRIMERLAASDSPLSTVSPLFTGGAKSLTAEFPYSGAIRVALAASGGSQPPETALLEVMTDQPHPEFGSGALMVLRLPVSLAAHTGAIMANELNLLESTTSTGTNLLGAWCVPPDSSEDDDVAFISFVPSMLARGGVLENLCLYFAARASWAQSVLSD
ncbi:MAG TPA: hypothetical protein VMS00_08145 [Acidimicrobiales bacterium]|nr:hypothetical protein [Acidimicrobiales bacterium]